MGARRAAQLCAVAVALCSLAPAVAQQGRPDEVAQAPSARTAAQEQESPLHLPADVLRALEQTQDLAFNFDQPGFYAVWAHLLRTPAPPGLEQAAESIDDWRAFVERPASLRGRLVRVSGRVGRNKTWRLTEGELQRPVSQVELESAGQPIACTVIFVNPADDVPVGATIDVAGYFVMVRQYYTPSNRVGQAALIVAWAPAVISQVGPPRAAGGETGWMWVPWAVALGLLVAWLVLRRGGEQRLRGRESLRAAHGAPFSVADDLARWAREEGPAAVPDAEARGGEIDGGESSAGQQSREKDAGGVT